MPYIGAHKVPLQKTIVAWEGTPAVSRLLHDATPLLKKLTQVYILASANDDTSTGTYVRLTEY
jgi:hypothetical protein